MHYFRLFFLPGGSINWTYQFKNFQRFLNEISQKCDDNQKIIFITQYVLPPELEGLGKYKNILLKTKVQIET